MIAERYHVNEQTVATWTHVENFPAVARVSPGPLPRLGTRLWHGAEVAGWVGAHEERRRLARENSRRIRLEREARARYQPEPFNGCVNFNPARPMDCKGTIADRNHEAEDLAWSRCDAHWLEHVENVRQQVAEDQDQGRP